MTTSKKYCTLKGAMQFREIASNMTKLGYSMNHATARAHFLRAVAKIADEMIVQLTGARNAKMAEELSRDSDFVNFLYDVMRE